MQERERVEVEAAAFRALLEHLRERSDVQNVDLMELAGFCRNCLARWYAEAAAERGAELSKDEAREIVYGMPYEEWKAAHQAPRSRGAARAQEAAGSHGPPRSQGAARSRGATSGRGAASA